MRLSDEQLEDVMLAIREAERPVDALVEALRRTFLALGAPDLSLPEARIDGRRYRLSSEQWRAICGALIEYGKASGFEQVNLGLDWMNYGPSGEADDASG